MFDFNVTDKEVMLAAEEQHRSEKKVAVWKILEEKYPEKYKNKRSRINSSISRLGDNGHLEATKVDLKDGSHYIVESITASGWDLIEEIKNAEEPSPEKESIDEVTDRPSQRKAPPNTARADRTILRRKILEKAYSKLTKKAELLNIEGFSQAEIRDEANKLIEAEYIDAQDAFDGITYGIYLLGITLKGEEYLQNGLSSKPEIDINIVPAHIKTPADPERWFNGIIKKSLSVALGGLIVYYHAHLLSFLKYIFSIVF